jgi:hypothetical protein
MVHQNSPRERGLNRFSMCSRGQFGNLPDGP